MTLSNSSPLPVIQDRIFFSVAVISGLVGSLLSVVFGKSSWILILLTLVCVVQIGVFFRNTFRYGLVGIVFLSIGMGIGWCREVQIEQNSHVFLEAAHYGIKTVDVTGIIERKVGENEK